MSSSSTIAFPPCSLSPYHELTSCSFLALPLQCRWLHRAAWVQTELFLTFPPPALVAISLIPLNTQETGGRFRVWLFKGQEEGKQGELVWDRKIEGGFPELKLLVSAFVWETEPDERRC